MPWTVKNKFSERVKSSQVKSSQVKSSQVQISMAAAPAAFGAPAGARDREGAARRNWHGWMALSQGFIHIVFFLIIAAPQVTNFVPFSGCLLYGYANPIQADDGSDRGPAQGLFRWANGQGVGRVTGDRRRARPTDPPRRVLTVLGLTRARQPCRSGPALWQGRLRALLIARRTPPRAI